MNAPNFLYFAYGSNMNPDRARARIPDARPVGRATLHGWRSALPSLYETKIKRIIEMLELSRVRIRPIRENIDAIIVNLREAIEEMANVKILHP